MADQADFDVLSDEKELSKRRKKAEDEYRDFSTDQIEYMRRRCKNDLFFLANGPLEYTLLSPRLHGDVAGWMGDTRNDQYRMMLLPRDHYKSTISTIAESVQMALPNVAELTAHPYCLGPNIKLLLAHEVRESAARFLYEITAAFLRKPGMLALFPECIPTKRLHRINKWELELPRTEHHKEPTFDTIGAGGAAQSRHYHWLKLDDLVGEEARDSMTVMGRVLTWFDNVNSLLTRLKVDGWDLIGTRWAYSDVYSHAMKQYGINLRGSVLNCIPQRDQDDHGGGLLKVYARGAIENGVPIFPEENPLQVLSVIRKNRLVWAAQYANNPMESGMNEFGWPLKFYNVDASGNIIVFTGDSSFKRRPHELDIVVMIDPSLGESMRADETGIVVTGTDERNNVFILETVKKHLKAPEVISEMFRLYTKYHPRLISVESVAFSLLYKYWFEEKCEELGIFPNIYPYKPGTRKSKGSRIRGLGSLFAAGQVYCSEGMMQFRDEYERFPMTDSEHLLDALAQGPEVWQRGLRQTDMEDRHVTHQHFEDERSPLTGY